MARKSKGKQLQNKISMASNKTIDGMNTLSKKFLSAITNGSDEKSTIAGKGNEFQEILDRELDLAKGVSRGSIVDFISSITTASSPNARNASPEVDSGNIFTKDVGNIFGYFQDMYRNRYIEMQDLSFVSKFIPVIGEAVKITLDSIVSSDNITDSITRVLDLPPSVPDTESQQIRDEIERIEKSTKLLKKLRNVSYKKALVTGRSYINAVAYKDLFQEYQRKKIRDQKEAILKNGATSKNLSMFQQGKGEKPFQEQMGEYGTSLEQDFSGFAEWDLDLSESIGPVMEGLEASLILEAGASSDREQKQNISKDVKQFQSDLMNSIGTITVDTCPYLDVAMEAMEVQDRNAAYFQGIHDDRAKANFDPTLIPDGTKNPGRDKVEEFTIDGTYLKWIDCKSVIPVEIFGEKVGFYYVHPTGRKVRKNDATVLVTPSVFSSVNISQKKKEDAIEQIANSISQSIMKQFSSKFVNDNAEHRKMIADCIVATGLVDNDFRIQFIPADQMIEFRINEDENGNGTSMLADSLFPSKLLLSLLICKLLTYMNKSGNKTIAHIYKGPIDPFSNNQLNRVVRMLQESNITFNDLLSTNMVFSKFTRDSNIAIPKSRNGSNLVEFETQEGQNVDLDTPMETKLEQMAILGTGVPNVILDFSNDPNFSRQLTAANIKFAGRVATYQSDLEEPTTELYRILIQNSGLSDDLKKSALRLFEFRLPRPRVLANSNNGEFLENSLALNQKIGDLYFGESTATLPNAGQVKEEFTRIITKSNTPFIDWDSIEDAKRQAELTVSQRVAKQKLTKPTTSEEDADAQATDEPGAEEAGGEPTGGFSEFGEDEDM